MTVRELAALVGSQLESDAQGDQVITGIAALSDAGPGDATFYGNTKYLGQLKASKATVALVPADFEETVPPVTIRVENPTLAFSRLIERFTSKPPVFAPGIHPSAVVGKNVRLGENVSIQPCAVIEDGVEIGAGSVIGAQCYLGHDVRVGENCLLHARVTIGYRCILGNRVIIHSGCVVGADGFGYEFQNGRHVKIPQLGIVQIDDDVELGANSAVDRARFQKTHIGEGTKIDNLVQIGHNATIGKHSVICGIVGVSGSTKIGSYVSIGGLTGIAGHIEIGDKIMIGGGSGVNKSLSQSGLYMGYPITPGRHYQRQLLLIKTLPDLKERIVALEKLVDGSPKKHETSS